MANDIVHDSEKNVKPERLTELLARLLKLIEEHYKESCYDIAKMTAHLTISCLEEEYVLHERKKPKSVPLKFYKIFMAKDVDELKGILPDKFLDKVTVLAFKIADLLQWIIKKYESDPQHILRSAKYKPLVGVFSPKQLKEALMEFTGEEAEIPDYLLSKAIQRLLDSKILEIAEKPVRKGKKPETEEFFPSKVSCWYRITDEFRQGLLQKRSAEKIKCYLRRKIASNEKKDNIMESVEEWPTILTRIVTSRPPINIILKAIRETFKQRGLRIPIFLSSEDHVKVGLINRLIESLDHVITIKHKRRSQPRRKKRRSRRLS
ncbi:MAG: hypothetical protein DRN49_07155 [Thaumarchaeota archaeon]|nr:MAG: hypothetical protein DRN49_07155 [Nitrososphaerota archaeon]